MKYMMISVVAVLFLLVGLATARSLPDEENMMGKKLILTRREAESENLTNAETSNIKADLANSSIPSYLRDLYINLTYLGEDHMLDDEKINTARAYNNQAQYAKCGYVKFLVDNDTLGEEEVIKAELHLLQNNLTELPGHYNVDIFYLLNENDTESPLKYSFKHINSTPGWKILDITSLSLLWRKGWPNHGLQIRLTKGGETLPCEGVFAEEQDAQDSHVQPLLVVFTHDKNSRILNRILKESKPMVNRTSTQQQKRNTVNVENIACHRKEMIVTADSLNSTDIVILLPKKLDVGICEGHCKRLQPTPNTDHAYILSLYYRNNVDLSEVPSKCCVPTSYEKINMIFYNKASCEHILKKDVAVKAKKCICL